MNQVADWLPIFLIDELRACEYECVQEAEDADILK